MLKFRYICTVFAALLILAGCTAPSADVSEGSGAPGAAMLREAELYRSEALHLIAEYEDMKASGDNYAYQYQDKAEPADRP